MTVTYCYGIASMFPTCRNAIADLIHEPEPYLGALNGEAFAEARNLTVTGAASMR